MWPINQEPFEIVPCSRGNLVPLSYWLDNQFDSQTYRYRLVGEDVRCKGMKMLDPDHVRFVNPLVEGTAHRPERDQSLVPLGGRAWRMLWNRRAEIPALWWDICNVPGAGFSQFYFDGMHILNPHGIYCYAYLRRHEGQVWWGFSPVGYDWGAHVSSIVVKPSRTLWQN